MFSTLDHKTMLIFQKITNFFNDTFGIENFQMSKFFYMMCVATKVLELGVSSYANNNFPGFSVTLEVIMYAVTWRVIRKTEKLDPDSNIISPLVIVLGYFRFYTLIGIFLLPLFFSSLLVPGSEHVENIQTSGFFNYYIFGHAGTEVGQFICIYFASCIRPPRKTSKVKEFVNSLSKKPQTVLSVLKAP